MRSMIYQSTVNYRIRVNIREPVLCVFQERLVETSAIIEHGQVSIQKASMFIILNYVFKLRSFN